MRINAVDPIPLTARFDGDDLVVAYGGQAFTELEDVFPGSTPVPFVTATIGDFTTPSGVSYAVSAFTLVGGSLVPWDKRAGTNVSPQIPMPSAPGTNELRFTITAVATVGEVSARVASDPKIRITRQAGDDPR